MPARIEFAPGGLDGRLGRHDLVHMGDHGNQQPHRPVGRGPEYGAQLRREHFRPGQAVADGALPQGGVGRHGGLAVQRLV
ncbi:hypothetical protein D3C72_2079130 [compost metagenome]